MNSLIKTNKPHSLTLLDYITSHSETSRSNETSRINLYETWLQQHNMDVVTNFDLVAYRNYLMSKERVQDGLNKLSPVSAAAHMNSIKARYLYMLDNAPSQLRDFLYSQTPHDAAPSDRKAFVDEMLIRIRERVQDKRITVQVIRHTDETDERFTRLNLEEMLTFCELPLETNHNHEITGIRDSAILTILCMTGIREDELINLDVRDIYQKLSGYVALEVRRGKGAKQRVIPYGEFQDYVIERVRTWQNVSKIQTGALFRALTKWGTVRKSRISKRAINTIVGNYPTQFGENIVRMKPHDCRRSYARIMRYGFQMPIDAIAKNMGHENTKTTQSYIGTVDVTSRVPKK